ncbi:hypothetical protein BDD43_3736 [Mucilaginibacter gracilis]|uniref:Outer membrane protein with beta-barrel domain n=1 Tax=Mucilaginibacter gracilis TaxID=423350 RepID=A0A495J3G5_9SPHI|nr:hypothetical protein [Mucilaginibacter gracilis]RKR83526.1 hypothetical protein BDD43_3736 [Mucilaginibacter gracilis]
MRTEREKELDELFRKGLENPTRDTNFRDDDWDAMEALLDKNKKRRGIIFWLPILGSVAALLILALGWLFIGNKHNTHVTDKITHVNKPVSGNGRKLDTVTVTATARAGQPLLTNNSTANSSNKINNSNNTSQKAGASRIRNRSLLNKNFAYNAHLNNRYSDSYQQPNQTDNAGHIDILQVSNSNLLSANLPSINLPDMNSELANGKLPMATLKPIVNTLVGKNKPTIKKTGSFHPNLAITVLASPDINAVSSSFQNSKVGTNVGILFSVGVSKKFTISTGALYSNKPYMTDFGNYHTNYRFSTNPESVSANCKVLDIPINVDYQFYNKYKNKFSIGSGLSSYFMLRENYHYNYEYANTAGPVEYNIANKNKYFLGVLNLDVTYQRQINAKFSLNVQPYLKVPLTNIGYSQVKLQSTGVAVGVTWNVGSSPKH